MYTHICDYINKYIDLYYRYRLKKHLAKINIDNNILQFLYDLIDSLGVVQYYLYHDTGEIVISFRYNDWDLMFCNNSIAVGKKGFIFYNRIFIEDLFKHPIMKDKTPYHLDLFVENVTRKTNAVEKYY